MDVSPQFLGQAHDQVRPRLVVSRQLRHHTVANRHGLSRIGTFIGMDRSVRRQQRTRHRRRVLRRHGVRVGDRQFVALSVPSVSLDQDRCRVGRSDRYQVRRTLQPERFEPVPSRVQDTGRTPHAQEGIPLDRESIRRGVGRADAHSVPRQREGGRTGNLSRRRRRGHVPFGISGTRPPRTEESEERGGMAGVRMALSGRDTSRRRTVRSREGEEHRRRGRSVARRYCGEDERAGTRSRGWGRRAGTLPQHRLL
mmetsp:Transcript_60666/g.179915  ORF Transcript_60666/g.179915 Transcript_60666/m.179915 type:complete len:254 (+) Transcript_60666:733-1494(+)